MGYQKMGEIALKGSNKRRKNVFFFCWEGLEYKADFGPFILHRF